MITNPYKILEVSPNATNEEVKKAYRELSRKYHPDSYVDNPLAELAEEKFKEVQEAYDQIMKERENGYGTYSGGSSNYGNSNDAVELNSVVGYINARQYRAALNVLSGISNRTARWYYYSAAANAGIGNNVMAAEHIQQAMNMEPNNPEYTNLYNQLQWQNQRYQSTRYGSSRNGGGYNAGNLCCDLWCADTLCECMGGDLISCC